MDNDQTLLEKLTAIIYEEAGQDWDECRRAATYIVPIIRAERQEAYTQLAELYRGCINKTFHFDEDAHLRNMRRMEARYIALSLDSVVRSYSLLRTRLQSSHPKVRSVFQRCLWTLHARCPVGRCTMSTIPPNQRLAHSTSQLLYP